MTGLGAGADLRSETTPKLRRAGFRMLRDGVRSNPQCVASLGLAAKADTDPNSCWRLPGHRDVPRLSPSETRSAWNAPRIPYPGFGDRASEQRDAGRGDRPP